MLGLSSESGSAGEAAVTLVEWIDRTQAWHVLFMSVHMGLPSIFHIDCIASWIDLWILQFVISFLSSLWWVMTAIGTI